MKKHNSRMTAAVATILVFLLIGFARGSDLVWTGSAGGLWGSGLNWTNSAGEATAFATGDTVRFDDGASLKTVTLSASVTAGNILFDSDQNYTLTNASGGKIAQAATFVKRGGGTLTVGCAGHTYTSDIRIEAGTVVANVPNAGASSPLGSGTAERRIYVSTNATLRLAERNTFGGADTTALKAEIHVDQGLLEFGKPGGVKGVNTLGDLTLNNAVMAYTNMGEGTYGFLKVCRTFSLSGSQPYDFSNFSRSDLFMLLNSNPNTEFRVAEITGDAGADATFRFPLKHGPVNYPVSGLIKTGPGSLVLANASSTFRGNIEIREGELVAFAPKIDTNNAQTALGNARVSRGIYVGTNAALTFAERNTLGTAEGDTPAVAITVDHGTLAITNSGHTTFGALTLDSATFSYKDGYDATRGILRLGGKLTLKGDTPYAFDPPAGATFGFINLSASPLTEINVADITGDSGVDAAFAIPLKDFASSNSPTYAAGFIKTGTGTLYLTNALNNASSFSGDIEVREGTLIAETAGGSPLGNANVDRRILVSTNCTLQLRQRNTQGGAAATNSLKAEIVVDHGILLLGDVGVTKGVNTVGSLTLIDGTLNYTNMYNEPYGFLKVARVFRLQGTAPYLFEGSTLSGCFMLLNASPLTTFEVDDITTDTEPDATFHFPFKQHPSSTAGCGLIKSGGGTMRVTAVSTYLGETMVSNGVLRVDGSLNTSSLLTVFSGGWLGGTGTVKNATVQAGGGFDVIHGQAKPLTVTGTLSLEGGGTVRIQNPGSLPGREIQVTLATASGTVINEENAAAWSVEIDGVPSSVNYRLRVIGSTLVAGYAPKGTLLSVR
jgi:autotransporter-associated beta strand protein